MDTISPDDLLMYQAARRQVGLTERTLLQAQQAHQQAQTEHVKKVGALEFATQVIASRPGFPAGARFHPETGEIIRPDVATNAVNQLGPDSQATQMDQDG